MSNELVVITATADPEKTLKYWSSWRQLAADSFRLVMVVGGKGTQMDKVMTEEISEHFVGGDALVLRDLDGVINAFYAGVEEACKDCTPEIICCFHDDMEILLDPYEFTHVAIPMHWDLEVKAVFADPKVLLAGFGGGTGLGAADIYQSPYSPFQLARQDFVSNMRDAEAHGRRSTQVERVACLDGFSQIGRGDFIRECYTAARELGIVHHAYDSLFGAWCHKAGYEARMIPVACHHAGGVTAVRSEAYQQFARSRNPGGDGYFWEEAHKIMYEECRGILPIRFKE